MTIVSPTFQPEVDPTVIWVSPIDEEVFILVHAVEGVWPYKFNRPVTTKSLVPAI